MSDKKRLLEDWDKEQNKEQNIEFKFLMLVYLTMLVAFLIILPKIYIKNQIYYISRDISKLHSQYEVLSEENRILKQKLESIRFKNQVLDSVFIEIEEK